MRQPLIDQLATSSCHDLRCTCHEEEDRQDSSEDPDQGPR